MLELHTSKGLRLEWLEEVFEQERRGRYGLSTERSWGTKQITVAARTKKSFFRSKTVAGEHRGIKGIRLNLNPCSIQIAMLMIILN